MRNRSARLWLIGLGLALAACVSPRPPGLDRSSGTEQELGEALAVLRGTTSFATARVGRGARPTPATEAFAVVLADQHAAEIFRRLLDEKSLACRLYALCGLWLTDRPAYPAAAAALENESGSVTYFHGCVFSDVTARELVSRDIGNGTVPLGLQAFAAGR